MTKFVMYMQKFQAGRGEKIPPEREGYIPEDYLQSYTLSNTNFWLVVGKSLCKLPTPFISLRDLRFGVWSHGHMIYSATAKPHDESPYQIHFKFKQ